MQCLLTPLFLLAMAPSAQAAKPCDELVKEITAKLQAAGAKDYELEVVPSSLVVGGQVVGSCENGSKKVTYTKLKKPALKPTKPPQ